MTETQGSTTQASKSWRVLECTPRWGLDGKATGREVYIEIDGKWGDAGKDAKLIEAAPEMLEALRDVTSVLEAHIVSFAQDESTILTTAYAAIKKATL